MRVGTGRWVQVSSFATVGEAEAVATMLRAEGIEARVDDHDVPGLLGHVAGVRSAAIYVREADLGRASEALGSVSEADLEAEAMGEAPPAGRGEARPQDLAPPGRPPFREAGGLWRPARLLGIAVGAGGLLLFARACAG